MSLMLILGIIALPVAATFFLRANGPAVLFAALAGYFSYSLLGVPDSVYSEFANSFRLQPNVAGLLLIGLPPLVAVVATRKSTPHSKVLLHAIFGTAAGFVTVLAAIPAINSPELSTSSVWSEILEYQDLAALVVFVLGLGSFFMIKPKTHHAKHGK